MKKERRIERSEEENEKRRRKIKLEKIKTIEPEMTTKCGRRAKKKTKEKAIGKKRRNRREQNKIPSRSKKSKVTKTTKKRK
jgi:hypothetical protein